MDIVRQFRIGKCGASRFSIEKSTTNYGSKSMAKIAKTSRLTPTPKALQKALEQSASQAQKLADAFGVKVPFARPKKSPASSTAR